MVLARVKSDGSFDAASGRVEIRYKPNDGRSYQAGIRNLELQPGDLLPDDHCGEAGKAPSKTDRKAAAAQDIQAVPEGAWTVYADGACSGNPGPAGLGVVLVDPTGKMSEAYVYLGEGTNNIAELTAIKVAAEMLPAEAPAVIHTDSQYAIGILTKGWKAKANQALIAELKDVLKGRAFKFQYVPGHAGVPLNEKADELARRAVTSRSSSLPAKGE